MVIYIMHPSFIIILPCLLLQYCKCEYVAFNCYDVCRETPHETVLCKYVQMNTLENLGFLVPIMPYKDYRMCVVSQGH